MKVEQYGCIHYIAQCFDCEWDRAILTKETPTKLDVRNATRKHVRETGHTVTIESGKNTTYSKPSP